MSVKELLSPATMTLDLKARTPAEAFTELGRLLEKAGAVTDLTTYLGAVREREAKVHLRCWRVSSKLLSKACDLQP